MSFTPDHRRTVVLLALCQGLLLTNTVILMAVNAHAAGLTASASVNVTVSSPLPLATNLALNKTATQSSDYTAATTARLAVDGNTNGDLNVGPLAHTGLDSQPYWQVDLGASVNLSEIVIWNRTDSGTDRLTNFHVIISSFPISSRTLAKVQSQAGVTDLYFAGTAGAVSRFLTTRAGRYIRVQLEGTNYLNLAEVQVFGTLAPNSAPAVSISTPTTGTKFVAPASITINAVATDVDSNLARVEFYNGATLVGQKTTTPYNFNLSNVAAGDYAITVKAIDSAGLSSSASVNVTVKAAN